MLNEVTKFLPNPKQPANEWLTIVYLVMLGVLGVVDVFSDIDYTSPEGVLAALISIPAMLTARWKSYGGETVQQIREGLEADV